MTMLWLGMFPLLIVALVRRHGWEYVPLVLLLGVARWYAPGMEIGGVGDSLTLACFAGLWFVTGRTRSD